MAPDLAILIRPATSLRVPVLRFGYLASVRDHLRYQGAEVAFYGIDEASQIPSRQLEISSLRIRKALGDPYTSERYRLASNPGDVSHDWLKDTYVNGADGRIVSCTCLG